MSPIKAVFHLFTILVNVVDPDAMRIILKTTFTVRHDNFSYRNNFLLPKHETPKIEMHQKQTKINYNEGQSTTDAKSRSKSTNYMF